MCSPFIHHTSSSLDFLPLRHSFNRHHIPYSTTSALKVFAQLLNKAKVYDRLGKSNKNFSHIHTLCAGNCGKLSVCLELFAHLFFSWNTKWLHCWLLLCSAWGFGTWDQSERTWETPNFSLEQKPVKKLNEKKNYSLSQLSIRLGSFLPCEWTRIRWIHRREKSIFSWQLAAFSSPIRLFNRLFA